MSDQHHDHQTVGATGMQGDAEHGHAGTGAAAGHGAGTGGPYGAFQRMSLPLGAAGGTVAGGIAWPAQRPGGAWNVAGQGGPEHSPDAHHDPSYGAGADARMIVEGTAVEHPAAGPGAAYGGVHGDAEMAAPGPAAWAGHDPHADYGQAPGGGNGTHDGYGSAGHPEYANGEGNAPEQEDARAHGTDNEERGAQGGDAHRHAAWDATWDEEHATADPGAGHDDAAEDDGEEALVAGMDDGLEDVVVPPAGRPKRPMALGARIGFGLIAALGAGMVAFGGHAIFFKSAGKSAEVALDQADLPEGGLTGRRAIPVDPMTAMVAGHAHNSGGGAGGWGAPGADPASDRQAPVAPAVMSAEGGAGGRAVPAGVNRPVPPTDAFAIVGADAGAAAGGVSVSAAPPAMPAVAPATGSAGGAAAALPAVAAGGASSMMAAPVGGDDLKRLVEGLSAQVAALNAKIDAARPGADVDALRRDIAAVATRMDAVEQAGGTKPTTAAAKTGGVNPEAAKEVARAAADEAARKKHAGKPAVAEAAPGAGPAAPARRPAVAEARATAAERDVAGRGCRLHGATDATFGGAGGVAWISNRGRDAQQVEVGQKAPCIGRVTAIFADAHDWVVRGASGTLRMPHGG
ncbi:hypothetical protein [Azospirillum canadense]|uniref:hypothetical protein n=1 Tax=Azospirillum canadense TaxID=403962 RepID=UPI002227A1A8|nr:hypothetical protein [Azospirillum canadense]MCW2240375.1 outer membrane murein-binding lipoprotein Lpp [Azospirillum canadense]